MACGKVWQAGEKADYRHKEDFEHTKFLSHGTILTFFERLAERKNMSSSLPVSG
jgi:hypothetical protein